MPPSDWHDQARYRDRGHDELQAEVYRWALAGIGVERKPYTSRRNDVSLVLSEAHIEYPFTRRGKVIAFADVLKIFVPVDQDDNVLEDERSWYIAYEIKPHIDSIGSVIRQCKALEQCMTVGLAWETPRPLISTGAVVPYNDYRLPLLKEVFSNVMPWNDGAPLS